jgi:hypothetical protein
MIKIVMHRTALVFLLLVLPLVGHRELYAQWRGQRGSGSVTLAASIGKSDTEKRILAVLDDMDRDQSTTRRWPGWNSMSSCPST